jgi:hypothetical protein
MNMCERVEVHIQTLTFTCTWTSVVSLFTPVERAAGIHWTGGNWAPELSQNGVVEKSDPHWELSSISLDVQCSHPINGATRLEKEIGPIN